MKISNINNGMIRYYMVKKQDIQQFKIQYMPQILEHLQAGKKESKDVVVFLQGWPDNYVMWDWINWKQQLASQHLVFINFPNTNGKVDNKWGKDFPEIIEDLKFTLDSLNIENKNRVLVGHDWGCFYGYLFDQSYPKYFNQMIMMDVPAKTELKKPKEILYVMIYQIVLIISFLIGGPIGKMITQGAMKVFHHNPPYASQVNSSQNYPYYYLWKNMILSKIKNNKRYLSGYYPSVPVTYLYGSNKPFQFHGQKWLRIVNDCGGEVHKMEAGHWFMKKYAKFITDLIIRRIKPKL